MNLLSRVEDVCEPSLSDKSKWLYLEPWMGRCCTLGHHETRSGCRVRLLSSAVAMTSHNMRCFNPSQVFLRSWHPQGNCKTQARDDLQIGALQFYQSCCVVWRFGKSSPRETVVVFSDGSAFLSRLGGLQGHQNLV